jgi:hypothetical protein
MSVRATERLVGDLVIITGMKNCPQMVVKGYNVKTNLITTSWFTTSYEYQENSFPAASLDRVEPAKNSQKDKPSSNMKQKTKS